MGRILISEEEKNRILGMHQEATKKHYLGEQTTSTTGYTEGKITYKLPKITSNTALREFINFGGDKLETQLQLLRQLGLSWSQAPQPNPLDNINLPKIKTITNLDDPLLLSARALSNDFVEGLRAVAQTGITDVTKGQAVILNVLKSQNVNTSAYKNYLPVLQGLVNIQLAKV